MNNPPGGLRLPGGFLRAYMPPHERVGGIACRGGNLPPASIGGDWCVSGG